MVHQYKFDGQGVVLDTCSGAVHLVDDVAYDIIALWPEHTPEEIEREVLGRYGGRPDVTAGEVRECIADVDALVSSGQLYTPDTYEPLAGEYKERASGVIKALCLHVAHTCNLNCEYCFASQGKYHGERAVMSYEVGRQALDFLVAHSGARTNLEVDFFGGEPLMNWDVVKRLVVYARSIEPACGKRFRFTLTTNGVLLDDEVTDFCNREMTNVVLSLDGRPEVNDRFRVDAAGRGSYGRIVPNFQRFVSMRGGREYYMRGTYTHYNTDFTRDLFHMAGLGFRRLSMEPVVCPPGDPCALTEGDLPVLYEQYEILAREMLRRAREGDPLVFYHYMIDLKHGPCIYKRISGCGSGTEYMAVTPWGELFPCHQFVGEEKFSLGNIWDGVLHPEVQEEFRRCNAYSRGECRDCWARLYCSGGCAANSYHATGSVNGVYKYGCELFKKRIECAIWLQAMLAEDAGE